MKDDMSKSKKIGYVVLGVVAFVLLLGSVIVNLITEWWWFQNVSLSQIFTTILKAKILIGASAFGATFLVLFGNFRLAQALTKERRFSISLDKERRQTITKTGPLTKFTLPFSIFVSFLVGLIFTGSWDRVLKFLHQQPFATKAPIFGQNVAYYVFSLPFYEMLLGWGFWMVVLSGLSAGSIYFVRGVINFKQSEPLFAQKSARTHLLLLLGIFFALIACHVHFIKIPHLLYSQQGVVYGAGYTDIHARLPYLNIVCFLAGAVALLALVGIFNKSTKPLTVCIIVYFLAVILGGWAWPALMQNFVVAPNELTKETPYIKNNIQSTRKAYKLDDIKEKTLGKNIKEQSQKVLTAADIQNNPATIKNIRLWDRRPFLDTLGQIQEIRTYYDFGSVDNDRYHLQDGYRQIMLSPRELNSEQLPQQSFINKHLIYTHGYGVAAAPVNEVTPEGLPKLFVKDFPPSSSKKRLKVTRPQIYYGAKTHSFAIANTKLKEFDYPSGDQNVYTHYTGQGGVLIDSYFKKLLLALRFSSAKVFLSQDITPQSRALFHRNISERVNNAFSFLHFDKDPYVVITPEGHLKWIIDAYTASTRYPYSTPIQNEQVNPAPSFLKSDARVNYIRNSVKIVVDAFNGTMDAYIADPEDPIIQTYAQIFPQTFKPLAEMPDNLRAHIRYPEDLFSLQTSIYTLYHMQDPKVFYNREDKWEIPSFLSTRAHQTDPMMRHLIMKLPGQDKAEFVFILPFTPKGKDNMAAWMAARNDGTHYGELVVYRFSKKRLVFGPKQINNRIDQNTEISQQLSLWDQRGSTVIRGNLLVIPIEQSLIYVQPLYLRGEGGNIPELKRVIVASRNKIVMEPRLDQALRRLFGQAKPQKEEKPSPQAIPSTLLELTNQARTHYENALEAQRQGRWSVYGKEIEKLGEILNQIQNQGF